jgi:CRP-like cAMP-binding protein/Na+/melibiose symporter-like transporter
MTTGTEAITKKPPSPFLVFRHKNFSLMWTGQLVSTIGSALTSLAASIMVYRQTGGSALSVGLMLMATAAPSLLVGLVAGVFVDRYDRRRIMIIADLLRAVLVFLIPFLVPASIIWLYVIVILTSTIGQFFDPAYESVLPEVAPDEELAAANSLVAISSFGSTAIGFAAAGLIAAKYPIAYAFYLDAISFLISAGCILFLRVRKIETTEETSVGVVVSNLKSGINYLVKSPALRSIFLLAIPVAVSFGLANSLLLPFATRALNATTFEYGLQEGLTSVGFVIASLLMAGYLNRWREGQWMVVGLFGMGISALVYSQLHSIPLAIAIMMLSGFMNAPYSIARRLLVQRNTAADMRGRVSSAFFVSSNAFFLLGMAAAGLADVIDVRWLYLLSALITVGCGVFALVLPGIGQPAAEWRKALQLLRSAPATASLGLGRSVLPSDVDMLVGLIPSLVGLPRQDRERIITQGSVVEVQPGTKLMQAGEVGDDAYFVLQGKAVAGIAQEGGRYHSLSSMGPGDYFGEIAALTGAPRTADVVAEETSQLLHVPAPVLRGMMAQPDFARIVLSRMSERLARTSIRDLPRTVGITPEDARELRQERVAIKQPEIVIG